MIVSRLPSTHMPSVFSSTFGHTTASTPPSRKRNWIDRKRSPLRVVSSRTSPTSPTTLISSPERSGVMPMANTVYVVGSFCTSRENSLSVSSMPRSSRSHNCRSCSVESSTCEISISATGVGTDSPKMSNIDVWPDSRSLVCRCIVAMIRSADSSSAPRGPKSSNAPALTRLSSVLRLKPCASTLRQKSSSDSNGPPDSLAAISGSTAPAPTFFTADSPKRMPPRRSFTSSIEKRTVEWFTSGRSTSMLARRASRMHSAIFSELPENESMNAAKYSTG